MMITIGGTHARSRQHAAKPGRSFCHDHLPSHTGCLYARCGAAGTTTEYKNFCTQGVLRLCRLQEEQEQWGDIDVLFQQVGDYDSNEESVVAT